jgi:2-polyprenyl-6-methoxyphenol hydroxylase-like FAD-dependent oxidoreductase
VIGGGAAGASLAWLLAREGVAVRLVDRGNGPHSGPYETLLGSARAMLERTAFTALLEASAEPDPLRHGAIWGSDDVAWREDAPAGWLLRRGIFDERLRAAALRAGAVVEVGTFPPAERTRGDASRRLVIATGRGRYGGDPAAMGPAAVAFTFAGEPAATDRGTAVVEALPTGWVWTHAPAHGPASAAVVVDTEQVRDAGREALLAAAFAAARGPAGRMRDRRLTHTSDATPRCHAEAPGELRLGDAAAAIDPLASQGVEKAFAAADHAAAVLRTAVDRPAWWERLCACHARWERGLATAHADVAAGWYGRESRFAEEPFWRRRRTAAVPTPPSAGPWRVADDVQPVRVLVRQGPRFDEADGFRRDATDDERTHVGYVPVAPLLAAFRSPATLHVGVTRAGRDARLFVLPPRAVHAALLELVRTGWLVSLG